MPLKPGSRWRSVVCDTQVVVVRSGAGDVVLECGGHAMVPAEEQAPAGFVRQPEFAGGTAMGRRYEHADLGLDVLVTKAGHGSLSVAGTPLALKGSKPLPASD